MGEEWPWSEGSQDCVPRSPLSICDFGEGETQVASVSTFKISELLENPVSSVELQQVLVWD